MKKIVLFLALLASALAFAGQPEDLSSPDFYRRLGVERGSSPDEIRSAYRRLARKYHPDVASGERNKNENNMKAINEAYEDLKKAGQNEKFEAEPQGRAYQEPSRGQYEQQFTHRATFDSLSGAQREVYAAAMARFKYYEADTNRDLQGRGLRVTGIAVAYRVIQYEAGWLLDGTQTSDSVSSAYRGKKLDLGYEAAFNDFFLKKIRNEYGFFAAYAAEGLVDKSRVEVLKELLFVNDNSGAFSELASDIMQSMKLVPSSNLLELRQLNQVVQLSNLRLKPAGQFLLNELADVVQFYENLSFDDGTYTRPKSGSQTKTNSTNLSDLEIQILMELCELLLKGGRR